MNSTRCKGRAARPSPKRGLEARMQQAARKIRAHFTKPFQVHEPWGMALFSSVVPKTIRKAPTRRGISLSREELIVDIKSTRPLGLHPPQRQFVPLRGGLHNHCTKNWGITFRAPQIGDLRAV